MDEANTYDLNIEILATATAFSEATLRKYNPELLGIYEQLRESGEEVGRKMKSWPTENYGVDFAPADFERVYRITGNANFSKRVSASLLVAYDNGKIRGYLEANDPEKLKIYDGILRNAQQLFSTDPSFFSAWESRLRVH